MTGGGAVSNPVLDFQLQPTGARRNWRNVLNRQQFEAILQQHRDTAENDDLGLEVSHPCPSTRHRTSDCQ